MTVPLSHHHQLVRSPRVHVPACCDLNSCDPVCPGDLFLALSREGSRFKSEQPLNAELRAQMLEAVRALHR